MWIRRYGDGVILCAHFIIKICFKLKWLNDERSKVFNSECCKRVEMLELDNTHIRLESEPKGALHSIPIPTIHVMQPPRRILLAIHDEW